ncbi:DUF6233 domain-containing protein [Streptomyces sanglieri]|uniref:DUF6233 domain-containing protein n=1 Tax=Streptomyces sanglieri TaxID=193460 RepID=A0ABW2X929_9ACTN
MVRAFEAQTWRTQRGDRLRVRMARGGCYMARKIRAVTREQALQALVTDVQACIDRYRYANPSPA